MVDDPRRLAVLISGELCGTITEGLGLSYEFAYKPQWIDLKRPALSLSLPVTSTPAPAVLARAYFGGLLPEGAARRQIAEQKGIDELDDIALLALLGRECAGTVTIVPMHPNGSFDTGHGPGSISWLTESELSELVTSLRVPGSSDPIDRYSVSLAGAQLKRGVLVDIDTGLIGLPLGDEISSHILKLQPAGYDGMSAVEHCMQHLATDAGLRASKTTLRRVDNEPALLVERYDRTPGTTVGHPLRLHQEDMCQALGRLSSQKYERFQDNAAKGPTITEIVDLIRSHARPSVQAVDDILRLFWFNVIIGNIDAHAKNYSILYNQGMRQFAIAPLYDAICVSAFHAHETRDQRVAEEPLVMNVGGQTRIWKLTRNDITTFARTLNIAPSFVLRKIHKLASVINDVTDARIDQHQEHPDSAHPMLETARAELHNRCAFIQSITQR